MFDDVKQLARLAGWLMMLALAVLLAGMVVEQVKKQVSGIAKLA